MRSRLWLAAPLVALLVASGACAKPQARVEPVPPLVVPDAPPRIIAAAELPEPEEEIAGPPDPVPAPAPPTRKPPPRPATQKPDAKDEAQKVEPLPPVTEILEPPATAGPTLRTPQTANDREVDRKVREMLARATKALAGVDYSALNPDAKSQYDTAKRFIQQAEDAMKNKNYVFATYLAGKADTLASGLQGR